jgi:hypothetical protein
LYSGRKADFKNCRAGKERMPCFQNSMVEMQPVSLRTANKYRFKHAMEVIIVGTLFNVYSTVVVVVVVVVVIIIIIIIIIY